MSVVHQPGGRWWADVWWADGRRSAIRILSEVEQLAPRVARPLLVDRDGLGVGEEGRNRGERGVVT